MYRTTIERLLNYIEHLSNIIQIFIHFLIPVFW